MLPEGMRRFFRLGRAKDVAAEVDAELAFHLEAKTQALVAGGLTAEAARAEALRQFGDVRAARHELISSDSGEAAGRDRREWFGDWWMDVRHAARGLMRTPGMTATVVVLLALGIGANVAMLGILDRLLLRAPPFLVDPGALVRIAITESRGPNSFGSGARLGEITFDKGSYADLLEYRSGVPALESIAGYTYAWPERLGEIGDEHAKQSIVTGNYFRTIGARPAFGRVLDSTDAEGPAVAVLGHAFWQRQFADDSAAIGRTFTLDGRLYTVVGVMPRGFSGAEVDAPDVWTLAEHGGLQSNWRTSRNTYYFSLIARLPSGTDRTAIAERIAALRLRSPEHHIGANERVRLASIVPGWISLSESSEIRLSIAVAVVAALLLLITVANVAHILLVRAIARGREFAVRVALGAGWGRLLRSVLAESVLLALFGGIIAAGVGLGAGYALRTLLLPTYNWALPPLGPFSGVLAAGLTLGIGVVTGCVPAAQAGRQDALGALRTGVQRGRGWRGGVRGSLVAIQVAVSVVLLAGAGLFVRSLIEAGTVDHGMDLRHLVNAKLTLEGNVAARRQRLDEVLGATRQIPEVTGATVGWFAPFRSFSVGGIRLTERDTTLFAMQNVVDAGFFEATGLRIIEGRGIEYGDRFGAERVAVVDETLAKNFWPGSRVLGRCLNLQPDLGCRRVVGVVAWARSVEMKDLPKPQYYLPVTQVDTTLASFEMFIRTADDPERVVEPAWRVLNNFFPGYPRARVRSFNTLMEPEIRPWRVGVTLFCASAGLALLLAIVGLYAVMAFAVRQRSHEFGVRRALGAPARHLVRLVLGRGLLVAAAGVVLGTSIAYALGRFAAPLLYRTNPRDFPVLMVAALSLLVAACTASVVPALAAARADPRQALQAE
jgi:predicted permease